MKFTPLLPLISGLISLSAYASSPWDLNDVSILVPLPTAAEFTSSTDTLLGAKANGLGGALIPPQYYGLVPNISLTMTKGQVYSKLRVVAVRLDPCFGGPVSNTECRRQVRLVWQPLDVDTTDNNGQITTIDAAIHTFYDLSQDEFNTFAQSLKNIEEQSGVSTAGAPLGINPIIQSEGLHGEFFEALKSLVLSTVGQQNFTRITSMELTGLNNAWKFEGFDIVNGDSQPLIIPRTGNATLQTFSDASQPANNYYQGGIAPAPTGTDVLNLLIINSSKVSESDQDEIISETQAAYKIENPKNYNPDTMDCVSCHTAQAAKLWAIQAFPALDLAAKSEPFIYRVNGMDLTNSSPNQDKTNILRSFGYEGADMAVSQRVINESADVATQLNAATNFRAR